METKTTDFLSMEQLAERWDVTTRSIISWMKRDDFPRAMRLGRRTLRFRLQDVLEYETRLAGK